ncbi:MAG: hypothetical protein K8T91_06735 [Planctomycetes bacterium]|nr:hypothetical protein [Planctomycetota bacterium]
MPWTTNNSLRVYGPRRRPFDADTDAADLNADPPMWYAEVEIVEQHHNPTSPAWRHIFLRRDATSVPLHPNFEAHLPGTSVCRCKVLRLSVVLFLGNSGTHRLVLEPSDGAAIETSLLVHTSPEAWGFVPLRAPRMVCVGGEIETSLMQLASGTNWPIALSGWGLPESASLVAHSSGLAFKGRANLLWSSGAVATARYNILYPRPASSVRPPNGEPLVIEVDRQWLLSGTRESRPARRDLIDRFEELDRLMRSSTNEGNTKWLHLGLQNPAGPPRFHWRLPATGQKPEMRIERGETLATLSDQQLAVRGVVPRSTATIDGDLSIVDVGTDDFQIRLTAVRQLGVRCDATVEIPDKWAPLLSLTDTELVWLPGRMMTRAQAVSLRADFPQLVADDTLDRLISMATVEVPVPEGVTLNFTGPLAACTEIDRQRLRWFGVAFADSDPAFVDLIQRFQAATGKTSECLGRLLVLLRARVTYSSVDNGTGFAETVAWQSLETTYDANEAAQLLRTAYQCARPNPDESVHGKSDDYRVDPPALWGSLPLDDGWAMVPFFNLTDELYLRIYDPETVEPEAALLGGAAILGNDDPRLWSSHRDQQRWDLTLLDADQVTGSWQFHRQLGSWSLQRVILQLFQPEVVLNGFLWISTDGPTSEDSLPDFDAWPTAVRAVSLRSPRTWESYPSPYVLHFESGSLTRAASNDSLVPTYAELGNWQFEIRKNERPIRVQPFPAAPFHKVVDLSIAPNQPSSTDRLSMSWEIVWKKGQTIIAEALDELNRWANDIQNSPDFRRAVRALRVRALALPIDQPLTQSISEPFDLSPVSLPWPKSVAWGVLFDRIDFHTVIKWKGGIPKWEDFDLLRTWESDTQATPALRACATQGISDLGRGGAMSGTVFDAIVDSSYFKAGLASLPRPLVWRRHPTLPSVQALPLTQSLSPPNYPSSSRQLAPFELTFGTRPGSNGAAPSEAPPLPEKWIFGSRQAATQNQAKSWPVCLNAAPLPPAREWVGSQAGATHQGAQFLPLAYLSLPGLSAHPTKRGDVAPITDHTTGSWLPMQLSHGLPYLDEPHALAELPRDDEPSASPTVTAPSDEDVTQRPAPLKRESFAAAWQTLSNRGQLAATDAESALRTIPNSTSLEVPSLVEPFGWTVNVAMTAAQYPGQLTITDLSTGSMIVLTEPLGDGIVNVPPFDPARHTALRGFHGTFESFGSNRLKLSPYNEASTNQFDVVAGSLAMRLDGKRTRDQRGLLRGPAESSGTWLKTPVALQNRISTGTSEDSVSLWTSLQPVALNLRQFGSWKLWVRDLPVRGNAFQRMRSSLHEDVNDPLADSREWGHLEGYEWRLGDGKAESSLQFGPLRFFPIRLENVQFSGDDVHAAELVGRIQFRLASLRPDDPDAGEIVERLGDANVVRLSFTFVGGQPTFTSIRAEPGDPLAITNPQGDPISPQLAWPLHAAEGAARLRARGIHLLTLPNGDLALELVEARVDLSLFGAAWSPAFIDQPRFPSGSATPTPTPWNLDVSSSLTGGNPVRVASGQVTLDWLGGLHELKMVVEARWGLANRPHIEASKVLTLLPTPHYEIEGGFRIALSGSALPFTEIGHDEQPDEPRAVLTPAIQLTWKGFRAPVDPQNKIDSPMYVLPGFGVSSREYVDSSGHVVPNELLIDAPGYASLSFTASRTGGMPPEHPPRFSQVAGVAELIFNCKWGLALQEIERDKIQPRELTQATFSSSAGSVMVAMVSALSWSGNDVNVDTKLLLNGMLEVKNLVSWPKPVVTTTSDETDPANSSYTLQSASHDLSHWRHTARILLNQVELDKRHIALGTLAAGANPTLFTLVSQPTANDDPKLVQFLSVVEHQIVELDVALPAGGHAPVVSASPQEFRWTVTQEVRLAHPAALARYWNQFVPDNVPATSEQVTAELSRGTDGPLRSISRVVSGWLREGLLRELTGPRGGTGRLHELDAAAAVLELSAAFYLPRRGAEAAAPVAQQDFANVQVLPNQVDRAVATDLLDFVPLPQGQDPDDLEHWSVVVLPFLGRMQPIKHDGLVPINGSNDWDLDFTHASAKLGVDPVLWLTAAQRPPFVFDLTSRSPSANRRLTIADFDRVAEQNWSWLDVASLETGWFRLLTPPPELRRQKSNKRGEESVSSIMAALPVEGLGRLSRRTALAQAFDPDLLSYPPTSTAFVAPNEPLDFESRYGGLLVLHGVVHPSADLDGDGFEDYGFVAAGKRLSQILGLLIRPQASTDPTKILVLPALNLLPPRMPLKSGAARTRLSQSVSFAPSPYYALRRETVVSAPADVRPVVVFGDVITLNHRDAALAKPVVVASQLWQQQFAEDGTPQINSDTAGDILQWAEQTRRGLAPDSLVAVVRIRELLRIPESPLPCTRYRFIVLPPANPILLMARVPHSIRPELGLVRAREGQFGGTLLPNDMPAITLAPPQVRNVQPLYLESRPELPGGTPKPEELTWDFGYSGMYLDIALSASAVGLVDPPIRWWDAEPSIKRLWWLATSHPVQFDSKLPLGKSLLPKNFRAESIRSLLAAPPNVSCPEQPSLESALAAVEPAPKAGQPAPAELRPWQAVLPGAYQQFLIGGRPGVYATMRSLVLTQNVVTSSATWTFGGTWETDDQVLVSVGTKMLTVAAGSTQLNNVVTAVAVAISASTDVEFADIRAVANDATLTLISKVSGKPVSATICTIDADSSSADGQTIKPSDAVFGQYVVNSGSVPVQHRWPRPVHIPANQPVSHNPRAREIALLPWGSWFDLPEDHVSGPPTVASKPVDVVFTKNTQVYRQRTMADPDGNWRLAVDWWSLPAGEFEVTALDSLGGPIVCMPKKVKSYLRRSVDARSKPHDSLFTTQGGAAHELNVELAPLGVRPAEVPDSWSSEDGVKFHFVHKPESTSPSPWKVGPADLIMKLRSLDTSIQFKCEPLISTDSMERAFVPADDDEKAALQRLLDGTPHGAPLWFELPIKVDTTGGIESPPILASFCVRRVRSTELPLPLMPMYCRFEDPEYNRRLSTSTSRGNGIIQTPTPSQSAQVTIAADRQQYNPSTPIVMLVDLRNLNRLLGSTAVSNAECRLRIARIDRLGGRDWLTPYEKEPILVRQLTGSTVKIDARVLTLQFGSSQSISDDENMAGKFAINFKQKLSPGDRVELSLTGKISDTGLPPIKELVELASTTIQIVAKPVTPPPEAAYGLLRRLSANSPVVECVRFAWGPSAEKIDIVNPEDLLKETVRRRATFLWRDAIRPTGPDFGALSSSVQYAVQKLHASGSTLVPPFVEPTNDFAPSNDGDTEK